MSEEKKYENKKDEILSKVEEHISKEIEKIKSRKSLFETFDVSPLDFTISRIIKETFSKPYVVNDERQAKVLFRINRTVSRLHKYLIDLLMLLESGRVNDKATKEMAKELIVYYTSIISSLLMSYESIVSGVYNTGQNLMINQQPNGIQNQRQQNI